MQTVDASAADEAELLRGLRAGEDAAFERVMRELGGRLLATARRFLPNEEDARDAVQEGFLSAFKNIGRFDGKSKFSTWIHRIVINASLMKLRSKRRKPEMSLEGGLGVGEEPRREHPALTTGPLVSERLDDRALYQKMREQIDLLPDDYRTILMLRDVEGLNTEETALVLDISTSAVKTRLHRARIALRDRLAPSLEPLRREGGRP
jgi:RNA polymerase sigma-70 factor (ECF subfamily)